MRLFILIFGMYCVTNTVVFSDDGNTGAATDLVRDRNGEREKIQAEAHDDLFYLSSFDVLESRANELITKKTRFLDGLYQLNTFELGITSPAQNDEAGWQDLFKKLQAWRTAKPNSIVAASTEASAWTNYAWFARGDGYADTVTPESWKLFKDRLQKARQILEESYASHDKKDIPPIWYSALLTVALGQGWSHQDYDKWFEEAVASDPEYYDFYFDKAVYLLPRWCGADGESEKFAEVCGQKYGPEMYARICWSLSGYYYYNDFFAETHTQWPLMKAGFAAMEQRWPASLWNLNNFCHFACLAGDKATAQGLFQRIGMQNYALVWGRLKTFKAYQRWANSPGDTPPPPEPQ